VPGNMRIWIYQLPIYAGPKRAWGHHDLKEPYYPVIVILFLRNPMILIILGILFRYLIIIILQIL
jgi:hypothetical protein